MATGGADATDPSRDHLTVPRPRREPAGAVTAMRSGRSRGGPTGRATRRTPDAESRQWIEQLRAGHPLHHQTVARLRDVLQRVAVCELSRRRHQLGSIRGPEFDDLAEQAADDALVNVLARRHEFRGLSRFTTWAYTFVMFEVSAKVARHVWRRQASGIPQLHWDQLPDPIALRPHEPLERRARLEALSSGISQLTERQREVFVAVALNDVPIDVLAVKLGANRNAVYKNLFDARRQLRRRMAAAGHPVGHESAREPPADRNVRPGASPA